MLGSIWSILGIDPSSDTATIRRAYARQLRKTNPEDDEEGFKALRQAYEAALRQAAQKAGSPNAPAIEPPSSATDFGPATPRIHAPNPATANTTKERVGVDLVDEAPHAALCNRLGLLLSEKDVSPDALQAALSAVLSSPAMDSMAVYQRTETWLSELLARSQRRGDALLDTTLTHFGWEAAGKARTPAIATLLGRRDSLLFLQGLKRQDHSFHSAFVALNRKPKGRARLANQIEIGLAGSVAELLTLLRKQYPSLLADLDQGALAFWNDYLAKPRFGPVNFWLDLILPPFIAFLVVGNSNGPLTWTAFLGGYGITLAGLLSGQMIWLHGVARPRHRWRQGQELNARTWIRLGWAPMALAVLVASAALPPSGLASIGTVLLAALAATWSYVVGRPDTRFVDGWVLVRPRYLPLIAVPFLVAQMFLRPGVRMKWQLRAATTYGFLAIFWIATRAALPSGAWRQMTLPLMAAAFAFVIGARPLMNAWTGFGDERARMATLIGLGLVVAATPALLWIAAAEPKWSPMAAALVALLVLIHKIPALGLGGQATLIRDIAMRFGWLPWLVLGASDPFRQLNGQLLFGGLWLLTGVAVAVVGALRTETSAKVRAYTA